MSDTGRNPVVARYSNGKWSKPQKLNPDLYGGSAASPHHTVQAVDSAGNVTMVFAEDEVMKSSQYLIGDGQWHLTAMGSAADGGFVFSNPPVVTIDSGGVITAGWFSMRNVGGQQNTIVAANRFK